MHNGFVDEEIPDGPSNRDETYDRDDLEGKGVGKDQEDGQLGKGLQHAAVCHELLRRLHAALVHEVATQEVRNREIHRG